ncbi:MAG: thioredoxin [Solirubrobacterales bacterium]
MSTTVDIDEAGFDQKVLERSRKVPVVVDFWAEWCGPCRVLGPALEEAVRKRDGEVELVKVDVDGNQRLAASFGIQGIPAVKAFRDGEVVKEFVGAQPPAAIEAFLDELVPSEAERLTDAGDEDSYRRALEADSRHAPAAIGLARILLERDDHGEALERLRPFQADFVADGLAARAELALEGSEDGDSPGELSRAFEAWDAGDRGRALELLQEALEAAGDDERRDRIRRVMVAIFTELGPQDPLAREHRRRLAATLN